MPPIATQPPAVTLPVSAFVICKNEEAVIEACLRSVAFCAEIVVVDSGSTDGTLGLVRALHDEGLAIRLFEEAWRGYGAQKQFALEQCTQDWLLSIDSDERVSPRLAAAIPDAIAQEDVNVWRIKRYDYLVGYGYVPPSAHEKYNRRLFRRGTARFDAADIVHEGLRIEGPERKLREGGLMHFRTLGIGARFEKENQYSSLKAEMRARDGVPPKPVKMIVSPVVYFFRLYVGQNMWRCGWAGFAHSVKGAVYSFLTEAKRWEAAAAERHPPVEPAVIPKDY